MAMLGVTSLDQLDACFLRRQPELHPSPGQPHDRTADPLAAARIDAAPIEAFRDIPVANVSDCMTRMTRRRPAPAPDAQGGRMAGPALTVKTRPGDNLMIHKAIDMAEPGDVIVVDGGGDLTNALIGELMTTYAIKPRRRRLRHRRRDPRPGRHRRRQLPVYAAGVTHRGPYKDGPGEINVPIAIDGMVIQPGDLILGDADGVLCVPLTTPKRCWRPRAPRWTPSRRRCRTSPRARSTPSWIEATLRRIGCPVAPP